MFHLLAYQGTATTAAPNTALLAVPDSVFSRRNNNFIFSGPYQMLAAFYHGVTPTAARFNVPTWNALGRHHIWPLEASATIPDQPQCQDLREYPISFPLREEISIEASCSAAGPEQHEAFLFISPPGWNRNLPRGERRITIAATGAVAGVAAAWSGLGAITLADGLKGGYYTLCGANCFDAGVLAVRFQFPRQPLVEGRQLRPGILAQEAIGNTPFLLNNGGFGPLGAFDSDELPSIEVFANATGASAQVLRLDLIYHGNARPEGYF